MESFATGLKRIYDACKEAGVEVEFLRDDYGFTVRFHRHCGEGWNQDQHQNQHQGANTGADDETTGVDWEIRKNAIIELVRNDTSISRKKIAKETGYTARQVERSLDLLKQEGRIVREGPAHGGKWIIYD